MASTLYQYSITQQNQALPNTHHLLSCDCFIFHFNFTHQLQLFFPQDLIVPLNSIQQSFLVPFNVFFSQTRETIETILSGTGVSMDFVETLVPEVYALAVEITRNSENAEPIVVPLDLDVLAVTPFDDREQIERAIVESGLVYNPVPAAKSLGAGLKTVNIENLGVSKECSICLEELSTGLEVVLMPCNHLQHKDCIVEWLKRSHIFLLCYRRWRESYGKFPVLCLELKCRGLDALASCYEYLS
ncbi:hypothetical protein ACFX1T_043747 [Malus domestica]